MENKGRKMLISILMIIMLTLIVEYLIVKSGSIQNKKQIIKEMTQSENEANLQTQINTLNASHNDYAINVQNYKKQVADAITNKGVTTLETATAEEMAANIEKISSRVKINIDANGTNIDASQGSIKWTTNLSFFQKSTYVLLDVTDYKRIEWTIQKNTDQTCTHYYYIDVKESLEAESIGRLTLAPTGNGTKTVSSDISGYTGKMYFVFEAVSINSMPEITGIEAYFI